jgi:protein required for attachment to host cells
MLIPHGTIVAVADGEAVHLFRNSGDEARPSLTGLSEPTIEGDSKDAGKRHRSSAANPDGKQLEEDSFAAAAAEFLNRQAHNKEGAGFIVIAAPKTLGELRKHYHKEFQARLLGEIAKEMTGSSVQEIQAALARA